MDLESQLKTALSRKKPSPDFAARVMQQVSRGLGPEARGLVRWRAAAAAVMLTALVGGWTAHTIAERRAGERAREDVMRALHIAGEKVRYAQTQVHEIGQR